MEPEKDEENIRMKFYDTTVMKRRYCEIIKDIMRKKKLKE